VEPARLTDMAVGKDVDLLLICVQSQFWHHYIRTNRGLAILICSEMIESTPAFAGLFPIAHAERNTQVFDAITLQQKSRDSDPLELRMLDFIEVRTMILWARSKRDGSDRFFVMNAPPHLQLGLETDSRRVLDLFRRCHVLSQHRYKGT
jgi:hypothetical protein